MRFFIFAMVAMVLAISAAFLLTNQPSRAPVPPATSAWCNSSTGHLADLIHPKDADPC
jgi:hypothetical protein